MGHGYRAVQWTPYKRRYDAALVLCVAVYLAVFVYIGKRAWTGDHAVSDPILLMRATGTCAILLLHVILSIGPMARLNRRFLPLLYNRRHMGVLMFLLALAHGGAAIAFYHGFGVVDPADSLLTSNMNYRSISQFPFEIPGVIALIILFVMAATSHDFWLKNLTPRVWKTLHMLVYVAYALIAAHVALGVLQAETSPVYAILLVFGVVWIGALHVIAGSRELARDATPTQIARSYWVDVAAVDDLVDGRGMAICLPGKERIAIFRSGDRISAMSNYCAHQGGPLGEGRIIDGCVTCPWHGFTYRFEDGTSPPPFTEQLPTYEVRIVGRRVLVHPAPDPPGQAKPPATIPATSAQTQATSVAEENHAPAK